MTSSEVWPCALSPSAYAAAGKSMIVAGQSAGWSGFPYWGSDIGGYFGWPDDEVFVRWARFSALTPIMEAHGLGVREPWSFSPSALETYRRFANLHARLAPYSRAAAREAYDTGMPLMRAMALAFPEDPQVHHDWVQYEYLYGPDLLAAPVYSWGRMRRMFLPPGDWVDFFGGACYSGPSTRPIPAPLEYLPLFARRGTVLPLLRDIATDSATALELLLFPGGSVERELADGTRLLAGSGPDTARVRVSGPDRAYTLSVAHGSVLQVEEHDVTLADGKARWRGSAELDLRLQAG